MANSLRVKTGLGLCMPDPGGKANARRVDETVFETLRRANDER
ncbi:hypothetical protein [Lichenibacterium minor]|nr:hypothetical protein [Lichenibacterium minor]